MNINLKLYHIKYFLNFATFHALYNALITYDNLAILALGHGLYILFILVDIDRSYNARVIKENQCWA